MKPTPSQRAELEALGASSLVRPFASARTSASGYTTTSTVAVSGSTSTIAAIRSTARAGASARARDSYARHVHVETMRAAYARLAGEYTARLGTIDAAAAADRELITSWGINLDGPVIDVGCGPGHWAAHLHEAGVEVRGVDPVAEFISSARVRHPMVRFDVGWAQELDADDASTAGVLAWYSLIHTRPDDVGAIFAEFARVLRPGGSLLVGYFAGAELVKFDHAVTPAYRWPPQTLAGLARNAGFEVNASHTRTEPQRRTHGDFVARRLP